MVKKNSTLLLNLIQGKYMFNIEWLDKLDHFFAYLFLFSFLLSFFFFFFFFFCRSTKINEIEEFMANFVFKPIKSSLGVLWHSPKRLFLLIQIINCTIYWFANDEQNILYFYMTRRFDKFTGGDFAIYTIATKV